MAKFCGRCGTRLDEQTGLCPNCDTSFQSGAADKKQRKEEKKISKKAGRPDMPFGKRVKRFFKRIFIEMLILTILAAGGMGVLVYYDILDFPAIEKLLYLTGLKERDPDDSRQDEKALDYEDYKVEAPDAEEYFRQHSQIIEQFYVQDSGNVLTEAESIHVLEERGFTGDPVTAEYTMDGVYSDAAAVSDTSADRHPAYQTAYTAGNGALWMIMIIDGDIMANPVSYNMQSSLDVQVVVAESDMITSYDSATNQFFKTIPDESEMIVRKVEKIDAETLETMTNEMLGG